MIRAQMQVIHSLSPDSCKAIVGKDVIQPSPVAKAALKCARALPTLFVVFVTNLQCLLCCHLSKLLASEAIVELRVEMIKWCLSAFASDRAEHKSE